MRFFACVVLLSSSLTVFAQDGRHSFSRLDIFSGLSQNQVNTILKDTDGFLWFGTQSGLDRYDGHSFKIFNKKYNDSSSLYDNFILSLYELPDGKMWVKTREGPCIYNSLTEKFDSGANRYLHTLGLPSGTVNSVVKGNNGRYWFLYDSLDLYLYSGTEKTAKPFRRHFKPSEKISSLAETKDGKLWLVYQNGVLQEYDIKEDSSIFSSTAVQELNKKNTAYYIFIDSDGDVWLWQYSYGVLLFHPPNNSVRRFNESSFPSRLSSNQAYQVVQDNKGLIWVATDHGGITLIDKKKNLRTSYLSNDPNDPQSISDNSIPALYKDDEGIIWAGTYKKGVNYFNGSIVQFPYYHHQGSNSKSLQYDDVNRFVEDKLGNIWIGTNGGGLICFDRKRNTFRQYVHDPNNTNSPSSNVIVALWIDHKDILWIGTFLGGLSSFDGKKFTHYRHNDDDPLSLANDNVWEIFEDREQRLWIGTLGSGVDLLDRKTGRFDHYQYKDNRQSQPLSNVISTFLQDNKGNIWIGTLSGIVVLEKNKNIPVFYRNTTDRHSLGDNNIICFLEDSKGRIWVGTRDGLDLFDRQTKTFQVFTTSDGLPDNMILNILEDNHQTLWISTPNGLCNAIPRQNDSGFASVINYDEINNLQNREFNDNAALKTRAGELIFGGPSGFNIIDPSVIPPPVNRPKILFTGLQLLNKNVQPGEMVNNRILLQQSISKVQSIDLKYKENVFSIEFASPDYGRGARDKYAYMMEGFNPDWLYADGSQRRATYTNLGPGNYVFKVKVLNRDGLWSDVKTLNINIEPPFWRTPAAFIIYVLIAAGILLLVRRITLDRIRMRFELQQQRREAERAHALEQMKTKFFTNVSHEFRTPLSLIMAPLNKIIEQAANEEQKKQLNLVQRNAKRLLNLVNQLLDFRKMEVQEIKLHPSIGDIVTFSKDISHSFIDIAEKKSIQFSFSSNIDSLEIYFDRDKVEKILFNLISNAYKYTHDKGIVSVNLIYKPPLNDEGDGTLAIEVKDTGIGIPPDMHEKIFERFFQTDVPDSMVNQGTGIGLAITKEFVKLHNGVITVQSAPEKGTCFTVHLPAKRIYEPSARAAVLPVQPDDDEQIILEKGRNSGKRKTIIIVEDNEDLRFYLKDNLKSQYHIEEAVNGKEGWEKVKLLNPDLVVSDIMMPLMDGVELARKIKTETLTAHIPIILLTAMGSEDQQLEGLKVGVNDYITKPFTFEILASRIRNLLTQQKLLQKRFQKQIEVNPAEVTITSVDEKFLQQALKIVEDHIDSPGFSVEDLSQEMHMNRVTLYRKILSLTGKTPIEFIRSIRLKRAVQLLEKSGKSVAEIAYEVGFNDPRLFTKFFKEEFKVTPSQYVANKKGNSL
ncbi:two-component regulator propeller domain-containing protein [Flavitalea sp. BT771]|uniref:hybrid sensor histidine kinase/response regulator transcription factor n=1 Tax=Flavitalea sp. BT771 TaxID=3063329 RepID=UPI0026E46066|nr:hybrid sensor histidine kinase/response regulator transcription factor [Flavitalea sp. BT771]MDO6430312.1 two-component regulator propeller domain-containing protein [Flavitalea sp. BT771]MDV6219548.1 two-component regulator propeller domain-containing protein [Flavitalea sp. BT771]